jgi:hypothetical protein
MADVDVHMLTVVRNGCVRRMKLGSRQVCESLSTGEGHLRGYDPAAMDSSSRRGRVAAALQRSFQHVARLGGLLTAAVDARRPGIRRRAVVRRQRRHATLGMLAPLIVTNLSSCARPRCHLGLELPCEAASCGCRQSFPDFCTHDRTGLTHMPGRPPRL